MEVHDGAVSRDGLGAVLAAGALAPVAQMGEGDVPVFWPWPAMEKPATRNSVSMLFFSWVR